MSYENLTLEELEQEATALRKKRSAVETRIKPLKKELDGLCTQQSLVKEAISTLKLSHLDSADFGERFKFLVNINNNGDSVYEARREMLSELRLYEFGYFQDNQQAIIQISRYFGEKMKTEDYLNLLEQSIKKIVPYLDPINDYKYIAITTYDCDYGYFLRVSKNDSEFTIIREGRGGLGDGFDLPQTSPMTLSDALQEVYKEYWVEKYED